MIRQFAKAVPRRLPGLGVFALVALMILAMAVAAMAYTASRLRDERLAELDRAAQMHARAFEDHLTLTFDVVDVTLQTFAAEAARQPDLDRLQSELHRAMIFAPYLRSLSVVNLRGEIVASSNAAQIGTRVSVERLWPDDSADALTLRLAPPWAGRDFADGRPIAPGHPVVADLTFWPIVRAVQGAETGRSIVAALNPEYFVNYQMLRLPDAMARVDIVRYDGLIMSSTDTRVRAGDDDTTRAAARVRDNADFGPLESTPDERAWTGAYRASRRYPLFVEIRLDHEIALAGWRAEVRRLFWGGVPTLLGMLMLAGYVYFRREFERVARRERADLERRRQARLLNGLKANLLLLDRAGQVVFANAGWRTFAEQSGVAQLTAPDGRPYQWIAVHLGATREEQHRLEAGFRGVLFGGWEGMVEEVHLETPHGRRWYEISAQAMTDDDAAMIVMQLDITERKHALANTELAARVFEASTEGIVVTDRHGAIMLVNPAFENITGYHAEEVLGRNPRLLASGMQTREFYAEMWRALETDGLWAGEITNRRKSGALYTEWLAISSIRDAHGQAVQYVAVFTDISERKAHEDRVRYLSEHDFLTGLHNRAGFHALCALAVEDAKQHEHRLAILFIDLDRFKLVNDTFGHATGDELLKAVTARIRQAMAPGVTLARQGGDEFLVLLPQLAQAGEAAQVADRLIEALAEPFDVQSHVLRVSASLGIAVYPEDGTEANALIRSADAAMYFSKDHGRNTYHFFSAWMHASAAERLEIESGLREALARDEFFVEYQPLIDLRQNRIVGAEALLRWHHPTRGRVMPSHFIDIAEDTGQIIAIGDWVLREVCRQLRQWREAGIVPPRIAINVSAAQLADPGFCDRVNRVLIEFEVEGSAIEFELTERVVMRTEDRCRPAIERLRARGIDFAIDDFGTGYSSLAYLHQLPIDKLKIDRAFIRDLAEDPDDAILTSTIITMAHNIGLQVLAEGVETQAQIDFLRRRHCDQYQGFWYAAAMPPDALAERLQTPVLVAINA